MTVTQQKREAVTPERSRRRGLTRGRLGLVAGLAGMLLLLLVEVTSGLFGRVPTVRYTPPVRSSDGAIAVNPAVTFSVHPTVAELQAAFAGAGYDLEDVRGMRAPVPRLRLFMLPSDLPEMTDIGERKTVFLSLALPLILEANAHIAVERRRLRHVIERRTAGRKIPPDLEDWLVGLATRYKGSADRLDALLLRVDTVPPSLVLAQAAAESGWGTSRFAVEGNAIFGQWTTSGGEGLVPLGRPEGETYKVRSFDRLIDSVNAYLLNLNTHRPYRGFRRLRAEMRRAGEPLDGARLTAGLQHYSETGQEYVDLLRGIIRKNRLSALDDATLGDAVIKFAWDV